MAKKKTTKANQSLSPENYIRQKARNLPIHSCWVNGDWEKSKMANVMVARVHTNGNITACVYLVDLMCLGVKDTHYFFNLPEDEYEALIERMDETYGAFQIEYDLAHNIVYSGIAFAGEYGFSPHKDFTITTRFLLEEDTDEIELMEIECGMDGKPVYTRGPLDNDLRANQIISQLERTAGRGNYDIGNTEVVESEEE